MGTVEAVCISAKKGIIKKPVEQVELKENWGIADDAHAGDWHRQVSLLAGESIDGVKDKLPQIGHGVFAENIVTRGVDLAGLKIGDQLLINGEVLLEITQIGKECHNSGCAIKKATGDCIMPREGIFSKVLKGGTVKAGQSIEVRPGTGSPQGAPEKTAP
ncbi:MOSC domain-containing protein [Desulfurivibrio alkaliphilus]|uniref:MOSC domain containing protein n=1 Tax=Desulfurivibrio alkaliphilus (strain DSM 19089 / UNIQEM U267 / AHT2) TaxID=589865 RepID=D6Z032_DESAT|nr:MOSC domain-containing protein [Desulfurivibrio alkaliphilus]ADH87065.1 MOSC domain containing protein [Desulfurivibrio alkaliphilus AHT 2]